ncbi:restriction endonuclease subunit S [Achromobacter xylosoxidans]|uniref:restriction endonuclease subunit S n=1 Tax=Alcaligenes xylosoxydans xylosoxydans TaxID=85698 RepID=UPI001FF39A1E|nr:restriction endonuclease subunit S [Achromobacter xylosoxidans]
MNTSDSIDMGQLCDLVSIQCNPSHIPEATYFGLEHLASGRMRPISSGRAADVQSHKFAFQRNDVLYGKLRPYLDKAVLADGDGVCTTELLVFRVKPGVAPRYLACVVHSPDFIEHAMSGVTGAHHPRTSWNHVSQFKLPRHDKREQANIARLLWNVNDLLFACEAAIESAGELKRAAMTRLFTRGLRGETQKETEIGLVPESWEFDSLGTHHTVVSGGTPPRSNSSFWTGGTIPWVKTTEVNYCVISETEEHITPRGLENSAAKMLPVGTLLMAMYGQGVTRGKVAILGIEATCNQACAAITPKNDAVLPRYLYHFLTWRYDEIRSLAHGGQQQNLNLEIVRDLPIVYPKTDDEQNQIITILDSIDRKIALHRQKSAVLDDLFQSLLHKLMTGEIRVADLDLSALSAAPAQIPEVTA